MTPVKKRKDSTDSKRAKKRRRDEKAVVVAARSPGGTAVQSTTGTKTRPEMNGLRWTGGSVARFLSTMRRAQFSIALRRSPGGIAALSRIAIEAELLPSATNRRRWQITGTAVPSTKTTKMEHLSYMLNLQSTSSSSRLVSGGARRSR